MLSNVHTELVAAAGQAAFWIHYPFDHYEPPEDNVDTAAARIGVPKGLGHLWDSLGQPMLDQ